MSSGYYLGVSVVSLAECIYNFQLATKDCKCMKKNDSGKLEESTNIAKILVLVIAIVYLALLVIGLYLSCIINSLSNQLPDDYLKMGTCKRFLACFCKIFPPVILIFSWVNFILIVACWIILWKDDCKFTSDSFKNDAETLNLVNSIIWIILHYGGAIIRDMTYQEPFMYAPVIGESNCCKTLILKKLGP